jgi:excisionase family DNA binding protein
MEQKLDLNSSKLLRANEVARILDVSPALIYRLIQKGHLKAVRIGSARRVLAEDLAKFIKENTSFQN